MKDNRIYYCTSQFEGFSYHQTHVEIKRKELKNTWVINVIVIHRFKFTYKIKCKNIKYLVPIIANLDGNVMAKKLRILSIKIYYYQRKGISNDQKVRKTVFQITILIHRFDFIHIIFDMYRT